jgi:hypothetical protein
METLSLSRNRIQGTLPINFGNQFSGPIPSSLALLPVVSSIVIQDNQFSGNLDFITNTSLPQCSFFDAGKSIHQSLFFYVYKK